MICLTSYFLCIMQQKVESSSLNKLEMLRKGDKIRIKILVFENSNLPVFLRRNLNTLEKN